jgi:NAD dependent epimerase/dehydratase family enzyme
VVAVGAHRRLVGIVRAALEDERFTGAVNATAPGAERQREVAKALGRAVHRPASLPAPAFALKLLLGGFAEELLGSRRVQPARATELGTRSATRSSTERSPDLTG